MKDEAREFFKTYQNNKTRSRYTNNYYMFIVYCRSVQNAKSKNECSLYVQQYEQFLENQGYSASTIHNRLVPVCLFLNVPLETITKPKRITSMYTRGRTGNRAIVSNCDVNNPIYKRSVEFQQRVGIRRDELRKLKGDDFIQDESGYWCVRVKRGKGGKQQLQRILPSDVDFVKSYFDGKKADENVFNQEEISGNNINYHLFRSQQAKKAYHFYLLKIEEGGEEYRHKLSEEIQKRAMLYHVNKKTGRYIAIPSKELTGYYWLRGANKKLAQENKLTVKYDRLAVMAVSVFHLSHWRADVTVASYLLAV